MAEQACSPVGELVLRTIAMPADTNPNGDIFGGWLLSQMDIAGGLAAKAASKSRIVTVAADSLVFLKPVKVGDAVCCYANIERIGRTSMVIHINVWVIRLPYDKPREKVTEARFTYVAVDDHGRPHAVDRETIFREPEEES